MEDVELSPEARREQDALRVSVERMRVERVDLEVENRAIQSIIEREARFAIHLREVLAASRVERQAIEAEKSRIFSAVGHS